jgi:hypothetical protein
MGQNIELSLAAEEFFFLFREVVADVFDHFVGGGLDLFFETLQIVLGNLAVFLGFLEGVHGVAADVADVDATFFGHAAGNLHELLATFAAELGEWDSDVGAVNGRVQAEVGLLDGLHDGLGDAFVPGLDLDEAGVGCGDGGAGFERLRGAVGFYHDAFHHGGRGLAGVDAAEFMQRVVEGLFHLGLHFVEGGMGHGIFDFGMGIFERSQFLNLELRKAGIGKGRTAGIGSRVPEFQI